MNRVYETRKARQDFEGLGELFLFLFPKSGSIYFFMLLGLVAAETIGEGEAYDSAKVHVVDTAAKFVVDPNSAYFGTADSYQKFDKRLKSGDCKGRSGSNPQSI